MWKKGSTEISRFGFQNVNNVAIATYKSPCSSAVAASGKFVKIFINIYKLK